MEWWEGALVGALGGFGNALLAGGERFKIWLPVKREEHIEFGVIGAIALGVLAALLAWATALHESSFFAQLGGCLLAGIGGSHYLISQAQARGYRTATTNTAGAADQLAAIQMDQMEAIAKGLARGTVQAAHEAARTQAQPATDATETENGPPSSHDVEGEQ